MKGIMWWVTVVVYWIVVGLCVIAATRAQPRLPWKISAVFFAILAINKQHDLTGYVTKLVRRTAVLHDWYGERRAFQWHVLTAIGLGVVAVLGAIWIWTSRLRWSVSQRLTLLGASALLGFAAARAVSLHGIDRMLYRDRSGIQLNWVFELGCLLVVVVTILLNLRGIPKAH